MSALEMINPVAIDPDDPVNHGRTLWCVHGSKHCPALMAVKLLAYTSDHVRLPVGRPGVVHVWGFSVWRRQPGFRTLGIRFDEWAKDFKICSLFLTQCEALKEVARLTKVPGEPHAARSHQ